MSPGYTYKQKNGIYRFTYNPIGALDILFNRIALDLQVYLQTDRGFGYTYPANI